MQQSDRLFPQLFADARITQECYHLMEILQHKVKIYFSLNDFSSKDHIEKMLTPSYFACQYYSKYVYDYDERTRSF